MSAIVTIVVFGGFVLWVACGLIRELLDEHEQRRRVAALDFERATVTHLYPSHRREVMATTKEAPTALTRPGADQSR